MIRIVKYITLLSLLLIPAFADVLNVYNPGYGGSGYVMGGEYVSPYNARWTTSGGNTTNLSVICDDFFAVTYLNQNYQVTTISFVDLPAQIGQTRWGTPNLPPNSAAPNALPLYYQAAWLTQHLLSETDPVIQGQISYAIWGIFNTAALNQTGVHNIGDVNRAAAQAWIDAAKAVSYTPAQVAQFANFVLFVPNPLNTQSQQEFLAIRTPEPAAIAIMVLMLLTLGGIVFFLQRRTSLRLLRTA